MGASDTTRGHSAPDGVARDSQNSAPARSLWERRYAKPESVHRLLAVDAVARYWVRIERERTAMWYAVGRQVLAAFREHDPDWSPGRHYASEVAAMVELWGLEPPARAALRESTLAAWEVERHRLTERHVIGVPLRFATVAFSAVRRGWLDPSSLQYVFAVRGRFGRRIRDPEARRALSTRRFASRKGISEMVVYVELCLAKPPPPMFRFEATLPPTMPVPSAEKASRAERSPLLQRRRSDCGVREERSIAFAVHAARASHGWTQRELAAKAGVSERTVSQVERGPFSWGGFHFNTVVRLAAALGVPVWYLLLPGQEWLRLLGIPPGVPKEADLVREDAFIDDIAAEVASRLPDADAALRAIATVAAVATGRLDVADFVAGGSVRR